MERLCCKTDQSVSGSHAGSRCCMQMCTWIEKSSGRCLTDASITNSDRSSAVRRPSQRFTTKSANLPDTDRVL